MMRLQMIAHNKQVVTYLVKASVVLLSIGSSSPSLPALTYSSKWQSSFLLN